MQMDMTMALGQPVNGTVAGNLAGKVTSQQDGTNGANRSFEALISQAIGVTTENTHHVSNTHPMTAQMMMPNSELLAELMALLNLAEGLSLSELNGEQKADLLEQLQQKLGELLDGLGEMDELPHELTAMFSSLQGMIRDANLTFPESSAQNLSIRHQDVQDKQTIAQIVRQIQQAFSSIGEMLKQTPNDASLLQLTSQLGQTVQLGTERYILSDFHVRAAAEKPMTTSVISNMISEINAGSGTSTLSEQSHRLADPKAALIMEATYSSTRSFGLERLAHMSNGSFHAAMVQETATINTVAEIQSSGAAPTNLLLHDEAAGMNMLNGQPVSEGNIVKQAPAQTVNTMIHMRHFEQEMGDQLIRMFNLSQQNGVSSAKITLVPEQLGQVDIRITIQNGQITAQFIADSILGRDALESQMAQLRAALQNQGLQVDKLEVSHMEPKPLDSQHGLFQEQRDPSSGHAHGSNSSSASKAGYENEEDWAAEQEMERVHASKDAYGSTFHATA